MNLLNDHDLHHGITSDKDAVMNACKTCHRDVLLEMLLKCRDMVGHTDNIFMIDAAIAQVKGSTS